MKTKHKSCVAAAAAAAGASEKMKSVILYPYGPLTGAGCCRMLHAKNLAITSAIYTINISLLIVLIYSWRINVNTRKSGELEDVYYGVQIAYFAIIGTQMSMIVLSIMLLFGIYKENTGLIVPWIIGYITFMALEAVAMVYSNVLRDHVNKQFDAMCKAEVAFFIGRAFINVLAMWGVMRFYNLVRAGITWKGPEVIELRYNASDSQQVETRLPGSTSHTYHISSKSHYHSQAQTTLIAATKTTTTTKKTARNTIRYDSRSRRRDSYGRIGGGGGGDEQHRKSTGCCFFDFDDYDDDDDYDDIGDDFDYDDYYDDGDDDDANGDCAMLGSGAAGGGSRNKHRPTHHRSHHRSHRGGNKNMRTVLIANRRYNNKYKIAHPQTRLEVINESERSAGSGSDENDSLLVAYDSTSSLASV